MADTIETDICVIGAGSGGLSVAAGASQLGARTVLIEKGKMGGDCLNYGCVPSKALIAAGHAAHAIRASGRFGIAPGVPSVDFRGVHDHVHGVIAAIAPNDSVERFTGLGVTVLQATARFTGPDEVEADGTRVRAKYFVVATGSSAGVPPIPGLDTVPYLTNETMFDLTEGPEHLIVIGGGPIGCELAQAHRRLGAEVTVLEMFTILGKDDPEVTGVVKRRMREEGIALREGIKIVGVAPDEAGVSVEIEQDGAVERIAGSHVLVAAGRSANVGGLNLEAAGVKYSKKGVDVDARLRSSNKRVYAIGDAAGGYQFTHVANYHAGIVIRNVLFWLPAKANSPAVPWVTYTDPEIAHVGMYEKDAREKGLEVTTLTVPLADVDRAVLDGETEGFARVHLKQGTDRILGATIVARHAGEMINEFSLAITNGLGMAAIGRTIHPYPTQAEVIKRLADAYNRTRLTPLVQRLLAGWLKWRRG